jgi:flagellar basal-body rod protein FlgB
VPNAFGSKRVASAAKLRRIACRAFTATAICCRAARPKKSQSVGIAGQSEVGTRLALDASDKTGMAMALNLDQLFASHLQALQIGNRRMELLAANIANADTPGYLARDIDFQAVMRGAAESGVDGNLAMRATTQGHINNQGGGSALAPALYRTSVQPSLDGNTVDTERESAAVAEAAIRYEAALMFFNSKVSGLRTAITGDR